MKKVLNLLVKGAGVVCLLAFAFLSWYAYELVDYWYFTPPCSERYYEVPAYSDKYQISKVQSDEINSGEYCQRIEDLDDQQRTTCKVQWIDEDAEFAFLEVHLKVDCHYNLQTGPDRYFQAVIIDGDVIPVDRFLEAEKYPERSGEYIEYLSLSLEEVDQIKEYLNDLGFSR